MGFLSTRTVSKHFYRKANPTEHMAYELIISEKPKQAFKIAYALSDTKPQIKRMGSVSYYETTYHGKRIIVAAAVGHLFGLKETESKQWEYPVFDVKWTPIFDVNPKAKFAKGYFNVLAKLAGEATEFTVSCDYDVEGELIGYNVLRFICKAKDGGRMKFSTLTVPDLQEAYKNKSPSVNLHQALAGETRHILDWYYGVNVSRALTKAIRSSGTFKVLSSGRIQGPALKILVDREREILAFVTKPYWELKYSGNLKKGALSGQHVEGKFWEKKKAQTIFKKCNGKDGKVESCEDSDYSQFPPPPFDLTSLQIEAYRAFGINPQETLNNAQALYLGGYISYPRTSSQKLPYQLGFAKILKSLSGIEKYSELCSALLAKDKLRPRQGKGDDPAHPAIYPTGNIPKKLTKAPEQIYDLIVRRFLACFGDPAERLARKIIFKVEGEDFLSEGIVTVKPGWHVFYGPYLHLNEKELPKAKQGDQVKFKNLEMNEDTTQPPKRFSQASLVKELSNRNLGTKGTRAQIVDTLFKRGYLLGREIKPTELGMQVITVLEKQVPKIIDEELTRSFEEDMEKIREGTLKEETVVEKAKKILST